MLLREPILINITKDSLYLKERGKEVFHRSDLYYTSSDKQKRKIFYNDPNHLMDDFDFALKTLKGILAKNEVKGFGSLIKPTMIINVVVTPNQVEINALKELAESAGVKELIILNDSQLPDEHLLIPNHKIPGRIIYGEDRYTSDDRHLFGLALFFLAFIWLLVVLKK